MQEQPDGNKRADDEMPAWYVVVFWLLVGVLFYLCRGLLYVFNAPGRWLDKWEGKG